MGRRASVSYGRTTGRWADSAITTSGTRTELVRASATRHPIQRLEALFDVHEGGSVISRKARVAEGALLGDRALHALEREVAQGIDAQRAPDLLDAQAAPDQLPFGGHVDPVEAGEPDRRA